MVSRKLAHVRAIVRKAKEVKDPLATFASAVRLCNNNAQLVQVRSYHAKDVPKDVQEWCLETCRENMASLYERVWSWSDTKKRKQLTSAASRFLIAHDAGPRRAPLAYVNYRFEEEEGQAVLYCYELQVLRTAQSRGLGRMLVELSEQIAWGAGMSKVMLTVFIENAAAVGFYRKLGYDLDETSPDYCSGSSKGARSSAGGGSGSTGTESSGAGSTHCKRNSSDGGSGGSSSMCSFNDIHGGSHGSQTDSGAAGVNCGYHIMSKRVPGTHQKRLVGQQEPVAAPAVSVREDAPTARPERDVPSSLDQLDLPLPPLPSLGSPSEIRHCKRQRLGAVEPQRGDSEVQKVFPSD